MTAAEDIEDEEPVKASKMPLIIGLVLALAGGGGGFMAVQMGLIGGGAKAASADDHGDDHGDSHGDDHGKAADLGGIGFLELDPVIISLPSGGGQRFLRFSAQLEINSTYEEEVTKIKPRVIDVLNGYLRAVETEELENPAALVRLRGQMLRRVQVVAGEDRIRDLLIMEFVIN
jgi:flagellar FliL protein